jgi:hypothetical protein
MHKAQGDDFPGYEVQSVKLVRGCPGEVAHMPPGAFEADHAGPPKGRAVGEFFEQIVFVFHCSSSLAIH